MAYIGSIPTKVVSRQSANIFTYTATANQTAFTGADTDGNTLACTPSDIMVHMNGLRLEQSDYTATTTTVTLGSGAAAGDEVTITAFLTFERDAAVTNVADNVVDEANLKVSNTPTNGYFLSAQSGNTGGLTWAATSAGVGGSTGVDFNDSVKARFGTGNDLEIYHDGSHSRIDDLGTGALLLQTNGTNIQLNKGTSENMLVANVDGSVDLYHDNTKRFETTSTGVNLIGSLGIGGANGSSGQYLKSNGSGSAPTWTTVSTGYGQYDSPIFYNITASGTITTYNLTVNGSFNNYSDDRLKVKSNNIPEALSKISQINGFYYTDSDAVTDIKKGLDAEGNQTYLEKTTSQKVGVSAQELEAVLPEVVSKLESSASATNTEYLGVDYTKIVPLLIEGIKELKTKVETLETKVAALEGG